MAVAILITLSLYIAHIMEDTSDLSDSGPPLPPAAFLRAHKHVPEITQNGLKLSTDGLDNVIRQQTMDRQSKFNEFLSNTGFLLLQFPTY